MKGFIEFVQTHYAEILEKTVEHLWLTFISVAIAIVVGVTLAIFLTRNKRSSGPVIGFVNIIQTIPSLALLGMFIPFLGIGVVPAIVALFLYALLPIVRNTYTGITEVDPSVTEVARGIGMTDMQVLGKVELPIAAPLIFAGIRTATVISIGVATLCALIAAGGLGEFIFRGIALNNLNMVIAGAIPSALLALFFDFALSLLERRSKNLKIPVLIFGLFTFVFIVVFMFNSGRDENAFRAGFASEFIEREDGFRGMQKVYGLDLEVLEMEVSLSYQALKNKEVDVIAGFSTDGRVEAYDLLVLRDDKNYFPPYHAAPIVNIATLNRLPELEEILAKISGRLDDAKMTKLNYKVDGLQHSPRQVAKEFLESEGFNTDMQREGNADILIGSKNFSESYILAEIFGILIENYSALDVKLELGFGGTKLLFDAMKNELIDLYPEYTGTGLLVLLDTDDSTKMTMIERRSELFDYVNTEFRRQYNIQWLTPLGFNNTHAVMMRREQAERLKIESISDLDRYLKEEDKKTYKK